MSNRVNNLIQMLDTYVDDGGFHLNVNVFNRDILLDAQAHPEKYPQLTIRVSGYAVNFIKLTKEQQDDVINRTIHESMQVISMKFCNCALPALRGNTDCCKNCVNNKEIPDGYMTEEEIGKLFEKINIKEKYEELVEYSENNSTRR